jgi:hypothetical protein
VEIFQFGLKSEAIIGTHLGSHFHRPSQIVLHGAKIFQVKDETRCVHCSTSLRVS